MNTKPDPAPSNTELELEFYRAVKDNDAGRTKELLQEPACSDLIRIDNKFLCKACSAGSAEVVRLLLDAGAEIDPANPLDWTPLHWACSSNKGGVEIVCTLIEAGCDVNAIDKDGQAPLHLACDKNLLAIVRLLLSRGAAIDAPGSWNYTPLHLASWQGHIDIVRLLIEAGADPNLKGAEDETALHLACTAGYLAIVQLLLDRGADVNATLFGDTPLHLATYHGKTDTVRLLLTARADAGIRDDRGRRTPLDIAVDNSIDNKEEILELFREHTPEAYFSKFCTMNTSPGGA